MDLTGDSKHCLLTVPVRTETEVRGVSVFVYRGGSNSSGLWDQYLEDLSYCVAPSLDRNGTTLNWFGLDHRYHFAQTAEVTELIQREG